ncbi:ppsC, partial [Symbiodinium microadriaticum]
AQGRYALLKTQFRFCSKGELGFINAKYIVSALPELEEKPFKTKRKVTVDGWDKEEEEEERKLPTTRRHLDRMHRVFRNNLSMCLLAFPLFTQFDVSKHDLDDWYDWFWGPDIAGRTPAPSEKTLLYAERNAWRSIHNLVFEGKSLKEAMLEIRADALFWTSLRKGEKGKPFARLPGKGSWKSKQPWPAYQPVFQPFLKQNGKGKDIPGKKGDQKGQGKDAWPSNWSRNKGHTLLPMDGCVMPPRTSIAPTTARTSEGSPTALTWREHGTGVPSRLVDRLKWSPDCSATQIPKDAIVMPLAGRDDAALLEAILHSQAPDLSSRVLAFDSSRKPNGKDLLDDALYGALCIAALQGGISFVGACPDFHTWGKDRWFQDSGDFHAERSRNARDWGIQALPVEALKVADEESLLLLRFLMLSWLAAKLATQGGQSQFLCFLELAEDPARGPSSLNGSKGSTRWGGCTTLPTLAGMGLLVQVPMLAIKDIQDVDSGYPVTLKEGVPLGVDTPTLQSPGVWPLKSELIGEEWDPIEAPPASGHKNYPSADMFRDEIRATFVEEISLAMVIGPCTRAEAAAHCHCTEEELCPCPMAGIDESDKIRSIFDGSKGGANLRIQQNTFQCLHWLRTARSRGDPGGWLPKLSASGDASVGSGRPWQLSGLTEVAQLGDEWWVNTVGTYGMASAQLYWGRMAAILLRIASWLLHESSSSLLATFLCLLLLALGTPLSWKRTLLAEVNTWLGFVIDPKGPCVQMARDKHLLVMGILEELKSGKVMSASQIASALGRLQWATTGLVMLVPLIMAAPLCGWLSNAASPSKSEVFWFHYQVTPEDHPWAFDKGCPKKRIAALEMFGTLVLAHFLMEKAPAFIPNLRIPLVSDNQGNVYSLLNDKCKKMPTSVVLMEILLQLHVHGMQLAPNTWADELTHPDFHGFTPSLCLPVKPVLKHFSLIRSILEDRIFDDTTDLTHGPVQKCAGRPVRMWLPPVQASLWTAQILEPVLVWKWSPNA